MIFPIAAWIRICERCLYAGKEQKAKHTKPNPSNIAPLYMQICMCACVYNIARHITHFTISINNINLSVAERTSSTHWSFSKNSDFKKQYTNHKRSYLIEGNSMVSSAVTNKSYCNFIQCNTCGFLV